MNVPEYVSREEVQRVCRELGLRDWTALSEPTIDMEEAQIILAQVNTAGMPIPLDTFQEGLEVELEHGIRFPDANVTNNHPLLTSKIVLAHLKESMDYYQRLAVAEIEGDLLKAAKSNDAARLLAKYRLLLDARLALAQSEAEAMDTLPSGK